MAEKKLQCVGVIGLGYVGLPLSLLLVKKGFDVIGVDIDKGKINDLNNGMSYITDIDPIQITDAFRTGRFKVTSGYEIVSKMDHIIICVPTPLKKNKEPELRYLLEVGSNLGEQPLEGKLIILESSTYPGTTTEVLKPLLEKNDLKVGKDIYLGYSPERIDPATRSIHVEDIPKVISGVTDECLKRVRTFYKKIFNEVVEVSSPEVAEFTKLLENSYRFINISFVNEMAMLCDGLNIDIWEAISAASTKPYGFTPFYPGPGVGGHCIPVDPFYLDWKARKVGIENSMINAAETINDRISEYIVNSLINHLPKPKDTKYKVFIYGIAYKKDINDARESHSIPIIKKLMSLGVDVSFHDPYINNIIVDQLELKSSPLTKEDLVNADCVLILTDHSSIPIELIIEHSTLIFDTKNVSSHFKGEAKIIRLGSGRQ
ncbi:UDP-N-acetyl-D-glucosamine dehydrogenase [Bacillus sp. AFS015802]|uniref:nucleotide sugar dehydrogenase n=1 Tax=Bacillus sp. AFS015802 TaxID=2033486 RepID=UPI000BF69BC5|nr:nucleotide sugar dehydrogenase [Bacillus sp. AFS015802]PFA67799.1 UDP-N-acetyl-D-glucosamine dehydrogenase [Bacillus sp. AFS015802]